MFNDLQTGLRVLRLASMRSAHIAGLRASRMVMDHSMAAAYGWRDRDLGHGSHCTKQGLRFTLSEPARRTALDCQRYGEEVKAGLHDKKKPKGIPKASSGIYPTQPDFLPSELGELF